MKIVEEEAINLASAYFFQAKKHNRKILFSIRNVKTTKWWNHFVKAAEFFMYKEDWQPYLFMEYMFNAKKDFMPFMLLRKETKDHFEDFKIINNNEDKLDQRLASIKYTIKYIFDWLQKGNKIEDFFENNKNIIFYEEENFSEYVLIFSKTFLKAIKQGKIKYDFTIEEIELKKLSLRKNEKLKKILIALLKEDYIP